LNEDKIKDFDAAYNTLQEVDTLTMQWVAAIEKPEI